MRVKQSGTKLVVGDRTVRALPYLKRHPRLSALRATVRQERSDLRGSPRLATEGMRTESCLRNPVTVTESAGHDCAPQRPLPWACSRFLPCCASTSTCRACSVTLSRHRLSLFAYLVCRRSTETYRGKSRSQRNRAFALPQRCNLFSSNFFWCVVSMTL